MTFTPCPRTGLAPVLYWFRTFDGHPREAGEARRFVSALLPDCGRMDEVLLAVDELVVNALRHTRSGQDGGTFTVEVAMAADLVAVSVVDEGGPSEPAVMESGELDESGRGLRMVSLTATTWGWHGNAAGRTVHAAFATGRRRAGQAGQAGQAGTAGRPPLDDVTDARVRLPRPAEEPAGSAHILNGVLGSLRAACAFPAPEPS